MFSVKASERALDYQWQFNGADLSGATGRRLTLTQVRPTRRQLPSRGEQRPGVVTSSNATLTVRSAAECNFGPTNRPASRLWTRWIAPRWALPLRVNYWSTSEVRTPRGQIHCAGA